MGAFRVFHSEGYLMLDAFQHDLCHGDVDFVGAIYLSLFVDF